MDFENFCNNKQQKEILQNLEQKGGEENVKKLLDRYKNKSSEELYAELLKLAKTEKEKGNLTEKRLNHIYNTLSPMLSENEKEKLKNLMKIIG